MTSYFVMMADDISLQCWDKRQFPVTFPWKHCSIFTFRWEDGTLWAVSDNFIDLYLPEISFLNILCWCSTKEIKVLTFISFESYWFHFNAHKPNQTYKKLIYNQLTERIPLLFCHFNYYACIWYIYNLSQHRIFIHQKKNI